MNRGNNANQEQSEQPGRPTTSRAAASARRAARSRSLDPVKYWGDPTSLPVRNDYSLETSDPTAVIRSLGKAPIPGKNSAPELYFEVLYNRAAGLAQALAFAGGLNEDDSEPTPGDEPAAS